MKMTIKAALATGLAAMVVTTPLPVMAATGVREHVRVQHAGIADASVAEYRRRYGRDRRLDARREVCECPTGRRTEAPLCAAGEKPPPETRALSAFRREAAADGSLAGDRFQDRPLCVIPTAPPARRP
jgi:hypothetical protein